MKARVTLMARKDKLWAAALAAVALSMAAPAWAPAWAQSVPLPKSRPQAKPPVAKLAAADDVVFAKPRNIPAGALVALIGSSGYLEVACVNGSAQAALGLKVGQDIAVSASDP